MLLENSSYLENYKRKNYLTKIDKHYQVNFASYHS